jgi:hypothetical protein
MALCDAHESQLKERAGVQGRLAGAWAGGTIERRGGFEMLDMEERKPPGGKFTTKFHKGSGILGSISRMRNIIVRLRRHLIRGSVK